MATDNPFIMRKLGEGLPSFKLDVWPAHCEQIGYTAVYNKFAQNPELKDYLLFTGGKPLYETSPFDKRGGISFRKDILQLIAKKSEWRKNIQ